MKPTLGEELRIFVFEGQSAEIKVVVDNWMEGFGKVFEVVDIQYNYQAPEYDGNTPITNYGRHGVLITARQLTVNDVCQRKGLQTFHDSDDRGKERARHDN